MSTQIDTPQSSGYVKIGLDDAERLRAKVRGFKRAALNIQLNAKAAVEWAEGIEQILSHVIDNRD